LELCGAFASLRTVGRQRGVTASPRYRNAVGPATFCGRIMRGGVAGYPAPLATWDARNRRVIGARLVICKIVFRIYIMFIKLYGMFLSFPNYKFLRHLSKMP
jgi:hypothetical protein